MGKDRPCQQARCLQEPCSVTKNEADVDVLSRKVVRDSIRGISESERRLGEELMADGYYHPSKG